LNAPKDLSPALYSPDFSPIELMSSKLKTLFRAEKARTREETEAALVRVLKQVTELGCRAWFRHCDYEAASDFESLSEIYLIFIFG